MDKNACFLSSQNEDVVESELGVQKSTITIAPERSQTGFYTTSCIRTRIYISMAKHRTFFFDLLNPTFLGPLGSKDSLPVSKPRSKGSLDVIGTERSLYPRDKDLIGSNLDSDS